MFEKEAEKIAERKISNFIPQQWGVSLIRTEPTWETVEGAPHFYLNSLAKMWQEGAEFGYNKVKKELEEEKKLNAEIKARFVKCNTCTDDMKSKCLMFTENLCEGERCEELIDIVSLVNKSDLERKIEALEKANEWHYVKDGDLPKENQLVLLYRENLNGANVALTYWYKSYVKDKVIAWKEIVLPELEENEKIK